MRRLAPFAFVVLLACDPAEVDRTLSGVFPCETTRECPESQSCVIGTCYREEPPRVSVRSPAAGTAFPIADGDTMALVVTIRGEHLHLVDPAEDPEHAFGLGNIAVLVDDAEQATITSGDLERGVTLEVVVEMTPGPHRIRAVPRNSAGKSYDHPGAEGRSLFWIDDGAPYVAFLEPFPGDVFPLQATTIDVEIATLNFTLDRPREVVDPNHERLGHAHAHYDDPFPLCVWDPACNSRHLGVLAPGTASTYAASVMRLPASAVTDAELEVVLRRVDHSPFAYPSWTERPVWDEIFIRRDDIDPVDDAVDD